MTISRSDDRPVALRAKIELPESDQVTGYRHNGTRLFSVTRVIDWIISEPNWLDQPDAVQDAVQAAGERGRLIHDATAVIDGHVMPDEDAAHIGLMASIDREASRAVAAWRPFCIRQELEILGTELQVVHPSMQYAGRLDRIVKHNRVSYVLDIKTPRRVPRTVGIQLAAYSRAVPETYEGFTALGRMVAQWTGDEWKLKTLPWQTAEREYGVFISALNVLKWRYADEPRS